MRRGLSALNVSRGKPMIPFARQRPRVFGRQQTPLALFLSPDVGDVAFDF